MTENARARPVLWSSNLVFILAATGSAVGLGNIWKFPYITGVYGGGAFVLVYLLCVLLVGVPIMIAEILIGRTARGNLIGAVRYVAETGGAWSGWRCIGWLGVLSSFLILSFYSVIPVGRWLTWLSLLQAHLWKL